MTTTIKRQAQGQPTGGQFAAHARQGSEVELQAPLDHTTDPSGEARAAAGAPGTHGATPGHWTRVDRAQAALAAPPKRRLRSDEQHGWDSLDGIEVTLDVTHQPMSWCAWKVGDSLRIARRTAVEDVDSSAPYWNARIERLTQIKDALFELADEAATAAGI